MTVKNLRFIAIALAAVAVSACQKEPSTSDLHKDYLVYTAYDTDADFAAVETYFIPDSILVIGNNDKTEYWKDADALGIVDAVVARMDAAGYVRSEDKQAANVGIQMSFVKQVTYFVGYDNPYWWWYYPYYWTPACLCHLSGQRARVCGKLELMPLASRYHYAGTVHCE